MTLTLAGVLATVAVLTGLVGEHIGHVWEQPAWIPILDLGIGWVLVGCGLIGAISRPSQPAGRRLVLAGFLWFVGTFQQQDLPVVDALAFAFQGYFNLVLALITLSFPRRWPGRREERAILFAIGLAFGVRSLARLVVSAREIIGFEIVGRAVALPLVAWTDVVLALLFIPAGWLMIRRWQTASGPMRHVIGPVVAAGAAAAFAEGFAVYDPLKLLDLIPALANAVMVPVAWALNVVRILVPLGMLQGILRQRAARSAIAQAITDVGETPSSQALRDALAGALRDPSLRILTWDDDAATYRDENGRRMPLPESSSAATMTPVDSAGRRLAVVIHDPALDEDPSLVSAGVAVTRLVIDNARLGVEIGRQLEEVRASRARIVEAGDAERRRIERDLHDGVQQRLVALAMELRRAGGGTEAQSQAGRALRHGADEALAAIEEVRELARGIHPAVLTEAGLAAALRALADRSPVPVEVEVDLGRAVTGTAAATAYFVAAEALANVAKHAHATNVRLSATTDDDRLTIRIDDDGVGAADATGSGLRGLADRVAALNGTFRTEPGAQVGTCVIALIPLE